MKTFCLKNLMKSKSKGNTVFTLPGHRLPSQYRTLLPVQNVKIERIAAMETASRRMRCAALVLTSLLLLLFVTVLALVISVKVTGTGSVDAATRVDVVTLQDGNVSGMKHQIQRQRPWAARCFKKCADYAGSRFNSTCRENFCRCYGDGYAELTCLPKFESCIIQRRLPSESLSAKYFGVSQKIYACQVQKQGTELSANPADNYRKREQAENLRKGENTKLMGRTQNDENIKEREQRSDPDVHVISVYSNSRTNMVLAHITSAQPRNITLVLASYQPVQWMVNLQKSIGLDKVILISNRQVSRSNLHYLNTKSHQGVKLTKQSILPEPSTPFPPSGIESESFVIRKLMPTGYGNDRWDGNTPRFLQTISNTIGRIKSFVGVAHTDSIRYDLDFTD